jgi:hypothetical protein
VITYMVAAPEVPASAGREVQIAAPDVLSYGEMLDLMADALGLRRRPPPAGADHHAVAVLALDRSRHPVDAGVARPS